MRSASIFAGQMTHCLATAIILAGVGLAACSDDEPSEPQASAPVPGAQETPSHKLEWLRLTDGIAPEQWLASREAGRSLDMQDPAVADMATCVMIGSAETRIVPRPSLPDLVYTPRFFAGGSH